VTLTITCLTSHDVFSDGQVDLEVKVTRSDGTQPMLSPSDINWWVDEGAMVPGTVHTYTDASGVYWVDRWHAPITTMDHNVTWHASVAGGNQCSNVMTVRADSGF
jgi:hypothetical protein